MITRKKYVAITIAALVVLSACGSVGNKSNMTPSLQAGNSSIATLPARQAREVEWDNIRTNARKEGSLSILLAAGASPVRNTLIQELKKFGVALETFIGPGGEQVNKINAERKAGIYNRDLYLGGTTTLILNLIPMGYIDPLEPQLLIPEVRDGRQWRSGELTWVDKDKKILAFSASVDGGVVINTSLVKQEEIASFRDLLNPKWKENMIMNDPTVTGTGLSWFATTEKIMGLDYIKNLALQKPIILRDQRLQVDWLAKGKYPVGIGILFQTVVEYMTSGAPLKQYLLKEGSYITSGASNLAIINKAPHPNAAKLFINWLLTKEGQTIWSKDIGNVSPRLDVPIDHVPAWRVPDPGTKYLLEYTEESQMEKARYMELAKEILATVK